ncbi:MAG TPA: hypothetical protein DEP53_06515 [Bacteroidetes bacterium]|nr:MAG: hypothetical protein A2W80_15835 [Candidatus Riflebacteria bacterium GWC2_50_8]HCA79373.1 hypothetical protein [Bacteroidota bacterium]
MRGVGLRAGDCALTYDDVDGKCPVLDNGHHVAFEKMAGVIMQREILEDRYCHGCLYHRKKQVEAVKASA